MHPIVIRLGRLGDMVLLAPMLHCIHERYGAACRLIGPGPWTAPIYASHADVAGVWEIQNRHRPPLLSPEYRRIAHTMAGETGPVYVAETEPRALEKIRQMLALAKIPAARCVFITEMDDRQGEHWVDRLLRFARQTPPAFASQPLPAVVGSMAAAPHLLVRDADRQDRDAWLGRRGLRNRALVLVQPANKQTIGKFGRRPLAEDDKSWPVASWSTLLHTVHTCLPEAAIILCGSPVENRVLESMRRAIRLDDVHVAARSLPLRRLMALQEIAHSMISVDTGPAHLAAAVGCPLVVLFGAVAPQVWAPRSAVGSQVISVGGAPQNSRADEIDAATVIQAWQNLLRNGRQ